MSKRVL